MTHLGYIRECVYIVTEGIFTVFYCIIPGISLLHIVFRRRIFTSWPFAVVLTASFLLSSLIIAIYQGIFCSFFGAHFSTVSTICFAIAVFCLFLTYSRSLIIEYWKALDERERVIIKVATAAFFFVLVIMPLSPYPSYEYMGLGEPGAYYRVTQNFIQGKGLLQDYYIMDFRSGNYSYLDSMPFLIFQASLLCKLFGINWYALFVYTSMSGILTIYLVSSLALQNRPINTVARERVQILLVLVLLAMPAYFVSIGFSVITLPGALIFLFIVALSIKPYVIEDRSIRYTLIGCSLLFLWFIRPEARYVSILFLALYLPSRLLFKGKAKERVICGVILTSIVILFWFKLPVIFDSLPKRYRSLSLFFQQYDQGSDSFKLLHGDLVTAGQETTYKNIVGEGGFNELINTSIGEEIRDHPWAFLKLITRDYYYAVNLLSYTFRSSKFFWEFHLKQNVVIFLLMNTMLFVILLRKEYRLIGLVIVFYLLTVRLSNTWIHTRHFLLVSFAILALMIRAIFDLVPRGSRDKFCGYFAKKGMVLIVSLPLIAAILFNCYTLVSFRLDGRNSGHVPIIEAIRKYTGSNDIIVSNSATLYACMTKRHCLGVMNIVAFLPLICRHLEPDAIVVSDARRDGPRSYSLYSRFIREVSGYKVVVDDKERKFVLLKRSN